MACMAVSFGAHRLRDEGKQGAAPEWLHQIRRASALGLPAHGRIVVGRDENAGWHRTVLG